jgi:Fe-S-cluster-containing dehydrogenase component
VAMDAGAMNRVYAVESMLTNTGGVADHRLPLKPSEIEGFLRAVARAVGVAGVPDAGTLSPLAAKWVQPLADDLKNAGVVLVGDTQPPAVHVLAHAINNTIGAYRDGIVTFTDPLEARPSADPMADFRALVDEMKGGKVDFLLVLGVNPVFDAPADLEFQKALDAVRGLTIHHGLYQDETGVLCRWHLNAAHYLESWGDVRGHDGTVTVQQPLIAPIFGGRSLIDLFTTLLDLGTGGLGAVQETWKAHAGASTDFEAWWQRVLKNGVVPNTALPAAAGVAFNAASLTNAALATPAPKGGLEIQFRPDLGIWDGRYANIGWLQEFPRPVTKLTWDNAAIVSPKTAADLGVNIDFAWTGGENGRAEADVVELTLDGRKLKAAVWILPGHADGVVTLHLGFGRERAGKVGNRTGFNAYQLRTTANLWTAGGLTVNKTNEEYHLACTQGQYAMEGRRPVRHATISQFREEKNHEFAKVPAATPGEHREIDELVPGTKAEWDRLHETETNKDARKYPIEVHEHKHPEPHDSRIIPLNLYPKYPQKVEGEQANKDYRRWGMAIDLGACTGCSTCIVACQAENNIPVVGKTQVTKGRAMHWLRIDRYFSIPGERVMEDHLGDKSTAQNFLRGNAARAEAVKKSDQIRAHFQPMMCVQCEKAPCEVVCPVGATVHTADGLNDMVYNRCVGTRYCSNNCPYKVRRFNFLQFADYHTESLKLLNNPEVTVRQRGVMEKCTYCVQRIRAAEIQAEREFATRPKDAGGRPKIMDGEVMTACQMACPTNAIVFGDINDPDSRVLRMKAEPHTYGVLAELNTMPRTSYLAQIRNPNPAMPKGA